MAERKGQSLGDMLDLGPVRSLLDELAGIEDATGQNKKDRSAVATDFTFRVPPDLLDEVRDMARERRCTVNAMMAGLVDLGLQSLGRPGIAARHPDYVAYLRRGRRGAA